ncbi:MAG: efflux RND transporter permease subunit, partial [Leptospiraceae bacterium]|nr:efflux RND transporter permease subunit [Leptospiraceae bacterium]
MKKAIHYFVGHPLLAWLTILSLILSGIMAIFSLRSEAYPNVDFNQVKITTVFPGSPPSDIEQLVTIPIEERLREVDGLEQVRSISRQSVSEILIKVDLEEKNPAKVVNDLQKAVDQVSDLPEQVTERPLFEERKSGKFPIMELSVYGDISSHELYQAAKLAEKELEKIPGVARVDLFGQRDREWHVLVNPDKMEKHNVNLQHVIQSIKLRNVNIPAGTFSRGDARNIRTTGEFETISEILDLPVIGNEVGNTIPLKLFSKTRDTFQRPEFLASTNGFPAINLLILKKEKGDILNTVSRIKAKLKEFDKTLPKGTKIAIINDEGKRTENRLNVVQSNAIIGFILVIVILVLFLSFRDSIITSLSLPLTLFGMLIIFPIYDITFNLVSMLGIIISLGMLVDNSIVISENIYRYREQGLDPLEAA